MPTDRRTWRHDPDATLDFAWNWRDTDNPKGPWLDDGETISDHTLIPVDCTIDENKSGLSGDVVTVWVTGIDANARTATVTCRITTSAGRTDDRTITLEVTER